MHKISQPFSFGQEHFAQEVQRRGVAPTLEEAFSNFQNDGVHLGMGPNLCFYHILGIQDPLTSYFRVLRCQGFDS